MEEAQPTLSLLFIEFDLDRHRDNSLLRLLNQPSSILADVSRRLRQQVLIMSRSPPHDNLRQSRHGPVSAPPVVVDLYLPIEIYDAHHAIRVHPAGPGMGATVAIRSRPNIAPITQGQNDQGARIKDEPHDGETSSLISNSDVGEDGLPCPTSKAPPPVSSVSQVDNPAGLSCANCMRKGHSLSQCIKTTKRGDVAGCPICEVTDHLIDDCPTKPTKYEVWERLVRDRARKPQIRSKSYDWVDLCRDRPKLKAGSYPWSRNFALSWHKIHPRSWETLDYSVPPPTVLPPDPETRTWQLAYAWQRNKKKARQRRAKKIANRKSRCTGTAAGSGSVTTKQEM